MQRLAAGEACAGRRPLHLAWWPALRGPPPWSPVLCRRPPRWQVFVCPARDLSKCGQERLAALRERVRDGDRRAWLDRARDQARGAKLGEPLGEHRVGYGPDRAREFAEACRPLAENAEDHRVPALAEEGERARERRIATQASLGHLAGSSELRHVSHDKHASTVAVTATNLVARYGTAIGNTAISEVATSAEVRRAAPAARQQCG
jgi:hypothetical protein